MILGIAQELTECPTLIGLRSSFSDAEQFDDFTAILTRISIERLLLDFERKPFAFLLAARDSRKG